MQVLEDTSLFVRFLFPFLCVWVTLWVRSAIASRVMIFMRERTRWHISFWWYFRSVLIATFSAQFVTASSPIASFCALGIALRAIFIFLCLNISTFHGFKYSVNIHRQIGSESLPFWSESALRIQIGNVNHHFVSEKWIRFCWLSPNVFCLVFFLFRSFCPKMSIWVMVSMGKLQSVPQIMPDTVNDDAGRDLWFGTIGCCDESGTGYRFLYTLNICSRRSSSQINCCLWNVLSQCCRFRPHSSESQNSIKKWTESRHFWEGNN